MKLTDWMSPPSKPTKPGPYEVKVGDGEDMLARPHWQKWNGEFWGLRKNTPEEAEKSGMWRSNEQTPTWRGLAEDPTCGDLLS